jgi:hypothetical protein
MLKWKAVAFGPRMTVSEKRLAVYGDIAADLIGAHGGEKSCFVSALTNPRAPFPFAAL